MWKSMLAFSNTHIKLSISQQCIHFFITLWSKQTRSYKALHCFPRNIMDCDDDLTGACLLAHAQIPMSWISEMPWIKLAGHNPRHCSQIRWKLREPLLFSQEVINEEATHINFSLAMPWLEVKEKEGTNRQNVTCVGIIGAIMIIMIV